MAPERKKEYLEALQKKILEITEEAVVDENVNGYICRAAFMTLREGRGLAFFESQIVDVWEDMPALSIRAIPEFVIADDCMDEAVKMVTQMGLCTPLGMLGVHYESRHIFWRLTLPVDVNKSPEEFAAETIVMYEKVAIQLGTFYDALERVATGQSKFADEVEAGKLIDQ
ncbi:MAG: hypothetical protein J5819_05055 [Eubacterium sp.]|nr:hypothetical protein [Eubacterium sp.]